MSEPFPGLSRRTLLGGLAAAPAAVLLPSAARAQNAATPDAAQRARAALKDARGTKLVLLGTGAGPVPGRTRRMTGHAIVHGQDTYMVDCGMGVTDRFAQAGIPFRSVRSIFITHHHPDHNVEYGPFLLVGWIQGLQLTTEAYGPPPLTQMTRDYLAAMRGTVDFWAEDLKMRPLHAIETHEVAQGGDVMRDRNVVVRAAVVQHPPVRPAFAYRFDFPDRSIVFSGDTVPLEAVAQLAKGADVLVHEAMDVSVTEAFVREQVRLGRPTTVEAFMAHMRADHSPTEEVGRIAHEAGVKTLVLSHLSPAIDTIPDESWRSAAAKTFAGEIVVGRDLTVI